MAEDDVLWSRWEEIDRLLEMALDHPESEQDQVLWRACGGDHELYAAVADLLDVSRDEDERITSPGRELLTAALPPDEEPGLAPDQVVGRYRILRELGQGGMATVYEAARSDGTYDQIVALKVLRRGLDTDRIVARFLTERQILSDFAHPHVARLLDGGATPDGRPFLVMEKVEGKALTLWADDEALDLRDRLELYLQVADAVKEAHRRLVVHRDLKPSNILVDRSGRVKLLDFGIAKLLHPQPGEGEVTQVGAYPLTRRWASPEQLRGEPVTTSSDIYQLGLLLCHLLTGVHPADEAGAPGPPGARTPSRILGGVADEERERLAERRSTTGRSLVRSLRGDLDTIVQTTLEPDPQDRYRSVEDLAEDVRRHLEGRPIRARPAPWPLRTRKWLERNRWAPPVAAVLAVVIGGYITTLSLTAQRLEGEREEARAQAERAERIKDFLVDIFRSADPWVAAEPGARTDISVAEVLEGAAGRVRSELRRDPAMQADLLASVASILTNLDRPSEALPLIEESLALRRRLDQTATPAYASDLQVLADAVQAETPDSAAELLTTAVEILEASVPPGDPRMAEALHSLLWYQFSALRNGDPATGERALEIYRAAGPSHRQQASGVLSTLAQVYAHLGRLEEAEEAAREAVRLRMENLGPDDARTAVARLALAQVLDGMQRYEEAIPLYRESLVVLERTVGPDHNQTLVTKNNLATTFYASGRLPEAVEMHRETLASRRRVAGTDLDQEVAGSLQNLAASLKEAGQLREADSLTAMAYDIYVAITPEGHYVRAFPLLTRTEILLRSNEPVRAEGTAREALGILLGSLPEGHHAIGVAHCRLGMALTAQGRALQAQPHLQAGLQIVRADGRTPPDYREECVQAAAAAGG